MTIYKYWETPKENEKRMKRDLMLASRKRWRGPPLGKLKKFADCRIRGRVANMWYRRRALSCGWRVPLRTWEEAH